MLSQEKAKAGGWRHVARHRKQPSSLASSCLCQTDSNIQLTRHKTTRFTLTPDKLPSFKASLHACRLLLPIVSTERRKIVGKMKIIHDYDQSVHHVLYNPDTNCPAPYMAANVCPVWSLKPFFIKQNFLIIYSTVPRSDGQLQSI